MFIRFDYTNSNETNTIVLIDSDFEDTLKLDCQWIDVFYAYEKRNLPVMPNLIKSIIWCSTNTGLKLHYIIGAASEHPEISNNEQFKKLLCLL